jgi:GDPmannose 4,6-dehydratase
LTNALVFGITGQTGSYLAAELLENNYEVFGFVRKENPLNAARLSALGIREDVTLLSGSYHKAKDIENAVIEADADVIFFLSGPSSVTGSFLQPGEFFSAITEPPMVLLEFISRQKGSVRVVNSGSTDSYGFRHGKRITEHFGFNPVSPYGFAKATTVEMLRFYRRELGIFASNGLLTNHESPLRGPNFLSARITSELKAIADGVRSKASFGNLAVIRDWLWAGDVARALIKIAEHREPGDYIVGSGNSVSARFLVETACTILGLETEAVVQEAETLFRPRDIPSVFLNSDKIYRKLGWEASVNPEELMRMILSGQLFPTS